MDIKTHNISIHKQQQQQQTKKIAMQYNVSGNANQPVWSTLGNALIVALAKITETEHKRQAH